MVRDTTLIQKTQRFLFFRYGKKSDTLAIITVAPGLSY